MPALGENIPLTPTKDWASFLEARWQYYYVGVLCHSFFARKELEGGYKLRLGV